METQDLSAQDIIESNKEKIQILFNKFGGEMSLDTFKDNIIPYVNYCYYNFLVGDYEAETINSYIVSALFDYLFSKENKLHRLFRCPGCEYLGKSTPLKPKFILECLLCTDRLRTSSKLEEKKISEVFARHNKRGFKCTECQRFIPQPLNNNAVVACPYLDCCFVGQVSSLKAMYHPSLLFTTKEIKKSSDASTSSVLNPQEEELRNIIVAKKNAVAFRSFESTVIHKVSMYEAFESILNKSSADLIEYLYESKRHGLQHRLFQEYVSILEKKIPFTVRKHKKITVIKSLLDPQLQIFDGLSTFEATVTDGKEIKNNTSEFYVGGRQGFHSRPYYIGKLLDVLDVSEKKSLIEDVKEYSFSKILLKNTKPGTKVIVSHLRVPPHYQMGGMSYLNRIRQEIVAEIKNEKA